MDDRFVQPDRDTIRRLRQSCSWSQEQLAEASTPDVVDGKCTYQGHAPGIPCRHTGDRG
jgi:hypothetical protein